MLINHTQKIISTKTIHSKEGRKKRKNVKERKKSSEQKIRWDSYIMSDGVDIKAKNKINKEGYFILIKDSVF